MQSYFRRCKHCQSEYLYRINGHRWGLPDYTSDYCPECQKAIDEALGKIPVKYEKRWKEIDNTLINDFIDWAKSTGQNEIKITKDEYCGEIYVIVRDRKKYSINNIDNRWCIYQMFYYDLINECFTTEEVDYNECDSVLRSLIQFSKKIVPQKPMAEPTGILSYMEIL